MPNKVLITGIFTFLFCFFVVGQEKKTEIPKELVIDSITEIKEPINPLSPAKAAFYSAVLPGLGQAYNKKYWKIPIVYGAIGTSVYFYIKNDNEYNRYRDAYKSRLAGFETDEFYFDSEGNKLSSPLVTTEGLERGQKFYRKNKELSLLIIIGTYALNIIWANVTAHLLQYNVDENLSLTPHYNTKEIDPISNVGLTLNFKF